MKKKSGMILQSMSKMVLLFFVVVSITVSPVNSIAVAAQSSSEAEAGVVVLDEQKKEAIGQNVEGEEQPILSEQKKSNAQSQSDDLGEKVEIPQSITESISNLSPWTKAGIGAGVILVAGIALSGGGSSGPSFPTEEKMVGTWNAQGVKTDGRDSYTGTYTLYNGGTHTYDIFVASFNERRTGNGTWYQAPETFSLVLKNDTGSLYQGDFVPGNLTTITLLTSDGRWRVTLTKM